MRRIEGMTEDDPQTVGDFLADTLTEDEFVDALVNAVTGGLLLKAIVGGSKSFRLYDWCFKHITQWEIRCERKYIEHYTSDPTRIKRITIIIPGIKLIRRPRKPK